eukprot:scaffold52432_cov52-Phaeocystis_antarctica.AAC.2
MERERGRPETQRRGAVWRASRVARDTPSYLSIHIHICQGAAHVGVAQGAQLQPLRRRASERVALRLRLHALRLQQVVRGRRTAG